MSNDCEEVEEWEKTEEEQRVFIIDYLYFNRNTKDSGKPKRRKDGKHLRYSQFRNMWKANF